MERQIIYINPAIDEETNIKRENNLKIVITEPDIIDKDTKILINIPGGNIVESQLNQILNKSLKNFKSKSNIISVIPYYHGIFNSNITEHEININTEFINKIKDLYDIDISFNIKESFGKIKKLGIDRLPDYIYLTKKKYNNEYVNYGYLPALDILEIIRYLKNKYGNRHYIFSGMSYGAYLIKLAYKINLYKKIIDPNLIDILIDHSGMIRYQSFADLDLKEINLYGITLKIKNYSPSSLIKNYEYFKKRVTTLPKNKNYKTKFYIFHGVDDQLIPYKEKRIEVDNFIKSGYDVYFKLITKDNMDDVFKNTNHFCGSTPSVVIKRVLDLEKKSKEN